MRDFVEAVNVTTHKYTKLLQFADKVLDLRVKQERIVFPTRPHFMPSVPDDATKLTVERLAAIRPRRAVKIITDEEIDRAGVPANDIFFWHLREMLEHLNKNLRILEEKDGSISIRMV